MLKILVIENEADIRNIITEILLAENFSVVPAEDGQIGLQLVQKEIPDLIICDINMPNINGYSVLNQLRQNPSTIAIPFIFLTASTAKTDRRMGMELGADDYLTKPFTKDELLAAIKTRLVRKAVITKESQKKVDELRYNITRALPHELHTPLNGILNLSKMLIEDYNVIDSDEAIEMLKEIYISGERLYRLTQNFLLFAELVRIEQEPKRAKSFLNVKGESFTKKIIKDIAFQKAQKANREEDLYLELQEVAIQIYSSKIEKIIEEIIDNAFKFSQVGTPVQVRSNYKDDHFHLVVIDHGRGMTVEQISNLGAYMQFERQLYEQQGSGLGLIIAKLLTKLNGGELNIESILGEKTIVHVILPGKL